MNAIRSVMTVFLAALITATILGWNWAVHLPEPKAEAARAVLGVAGLASLAAIVILWTNKPQKAH